MRERFEDPISKGQDPNADDEEKEWCKEQSKKLNDLTSMFMLRRTSEVIQKYLPDKSNSAIISDYGIIRVFLSFTISAEYVVFCRPSEFQLKLLSAVGKSRQVQQLLNNFTGSPPFASIDYMRKICNHPYIFYESAAQANSKEAQPQIGNFLDSEENSNGAIIGENSQSQVIPLEV